MIKLIIQLVIKIFSNVIFLLFISNSYNTFSQEYKNLRSYKKITDKNILCKGCWLKKDRKRNTEVWKQANKYNISLDSGYLKYGKINQIRDFYRWFDNERKKKGHEILSVGVMAIVANQFSNLDNWFITTFIIRSKEIIWFGNEGSKRVIKYYFPLLKHVFFTKNILKGEKAKEWDINNTKTEQCKIVAPLYKKMSPKGIHRLELMAKGKGIYFLGVKKELRFEGDIKSCQSKYKHALTKLTTYYLNQ